MAHKNLRLIRVTVRQISRKISRKSTDYSFSAEVRSPRPRWRLTSSTRRPDLVAKFCDLHVTRRTERKEKRTELTGEEREREESLLCHSLTVLTFELLPRSCFFSNNRHIFLAFNQIFQHLVCIIVQHLPVT